MAKGPLAPGHRLVHLLAEWRARGLRYESGYYHPGVARAIPEKVREIMRETGATRPAVYSALVLTADWDKVREMLASMLCHAPTVGYRGNSSTPTG